MEKDFVFVCERLRGMGEQKVRVHMQTVISGKFSLDRPVRSKVQIGARLTATSCPPGSSLRGSSVYAKSRKQ